ncbi:uncharacterized protein FA14DRAFT_189609 [Meira miltonrushii]|uniref:CMP/dCMP-type deaminase domain-containing protein n=1 Tax=Meira miltonrushii TaxID=1280837 RepID=A0A316VDU8_9BASI|nr:uncharacterized protein FA14DRAFT_189609 [Meira miltonrushii]PWN35670.1 hypothetical protein FA14DRAFT_189609 [Meira miltonrushii]
MASVEDEPISTLLKPLPLPPYEFDSALSEDENFLTWVSILARHSSSKKGHMGCILTRPPKQGDPTAASGSKGCLPPVQERIIHYSNNTPLLFARFAKGVPEVHAEALAISRCARLGIPIEGCTVYISFPPCNDCMKLLLSAGVKRCVFKKAILNQTSQGEAALVAAEVEGMELVGTLNPMVAGKGSNDEQASKTKAEERKLDEMRDKRVRQFWADQAEDAEKTRARNARWWEDYMSRYKAADKIIKERYGHSKVEQDEEKRAAEKQQRWEAKRLAQSQKPIGKKKAAKLAREIQQQAGTSANGDSINHSDDDDDLDELMNREVPRKRASADEEEDENQKAAKLE